MTVKVQHDDGIRHGTFNINGIKGTFPTQAITSTNLSHAESMNVPALDFHTKISEFAIKSPNRIITDKVYRDKYVSIIKQTIEKNPDKLHFLALNGIKKNGMSKSDNNKFIDFQIECGFTFIKSYFVVGMSTSADLKDYIAKIPNGKYLVPVLDEWLDNSDFEDLYNKTYESNAEIIAFLGRTPTLSNRDIKHNLNFIRDHDNDNILRLASFIEKKSGNVVNSLIYHLNGFDIFSFRTSYWKQDQPLSKLVVFNNFTIDKLHRNSKLKCAVTNDDLYNVAKNHFAGSSIPISIYNIVSLNKEFEIIYKKYTKKELKIIVQNRLL